MARTPYRSSDLRIAIDPSCKDLAAGLPRCCASSNRCRGRSAASETAVQNRTQPRRLGSSTSTTANPAQEINVNRADPSFQIARRVSNRAVVQANANPQPPRPCRRRSVSPPGHSAPRQRRSWPSVFHDDSSARFPIVEDLLCTGPVSVRSRGPHPIRSRVVQILCR